MHCGTDTLLYVLMYSYDTMVLVVMIVGIICNFHYWLVSVISIN
jgi:hypothetical protein